MAEPLWREAFGDEECPTLYSSVNHQKKDFAVLTSPKKFVKDLERLSHTQLYALAKNCQSALKTAQDEYLHIERLIRHLEQKDSPSKPQVLLEPDRFEEEKEATLYGYKRISRGRPYTRIKDGTDFYGFQEPFSQGGFVPTEAQYKRMKANAKDPNNVDDWTPIQRDGKKLIPRMSQSTQPRQRGFTGTLTRPSRKRRLVEQGYSDTDATATFSDSDAFNPPSKHGTHFLRPKVPPTRDPSETPVSHRSSPAPRRQHRFIMKNFTQALMSSSASTGPSINSTAAPKEPSPISFSNKRRRVTHQYHKRGLNKTITPGSSPFPRDAEEKKWTDVSLISAINTDHSFLHPDPAIALSWKTAIVNAPNPVRSYAMKRKWAWWKKGGMDKRPRKGWREGTGEGDESQDNDTQERRKMGGKGFRGSGLKKDEAAEEWEEDRVQHSARPPTLGESGSGEPKDLPDASEANDTKQSTVMKQQKDRQFTFKLDHPPPPQTSSTWIADERARG